MDNADKSDKTSNYYEKLSVIISEIVPEYLRQYFIDRWNAKFPEQPWKSGSESSGNDLIKAIPEKDLKRKDRKKFNGYKDKLHCGNEQEWDTAILIHIMIDFGLNICDNSVKGHIIKLREASSQFASFTQSKSAVLEKSNKMLAKITDAARNLFTNCEAAEEQISKVWHSENESSETDWQKTNTESAAGN